MKDFFLKVWAKKVGAHYTREHVIHKKICQVKKKNKNLRQGNMI